MTVTKLHIDAKIYSKDEIILMYGDQKFIVTGMERDCFGWLYTLEPYKKPSFLRRIWNWIKRFFNKKKDENK